MSFWKTVLLAWDFEPSIVVGCSALLLGYFLLSRFRWLAGTGFYVAGVVVMFLALVSPIDSLSDDYLFSAHMFQHLLLSQIVPPLLLLGIPVEWWQRWLSWPALAGVEQMLRKPALAWIVGVGALWAWHWPALFDLALRNENVHIVQHLCFMATGCIFWWPVVSPLPGHRMMPMPAVFYLFTACTISSLLGMFITFCSWDLYPYYDHPEDSLGILQTLRAHLTVQGDQQLGGLMMWVPCCLVYATAILITLGAWQDAEETTVVQHE